MKECLECKKEIVGKKNTAIFCSGACKVRHHRKGLSSKKESLQKIIERLKEELRITREEFNSVLESANKFNKDELIFNKPKKEKKQELNSNVRIVNKGKSIGEIKTLEELKAMCPSNLTGLDRSIWIEKQKEKYGIK